MSFSAIDLNHFIFSFVLSWFPFTESSPDPWLTKPDNWTGPDPFIYFSFETDSHLELFGGAQVTTEGRVSKFTQAFLRLFTFFVYLKIVLAY